MEILDGIAPLAARYDGWVLDLWGVVHDGRAPYPGVPDALARLRAQGARIVFLTNAPRRAHAVQGLLDRMRLDRALYDGIISSGEVAWAAMRDRDHPWFAGIGHNAVHVGPPRDLSVVEDAVATLVTDAKQADFVLNTGPDPDRSDRDLEPYRAVLAACAARRLPMICVNPDRFVMVGDDRLFCAGALADLYRELGGGAVLEIGKPDAMVYAPVMALLGTPPERTVAIGDSPHTDLAGARAAGLDAIWALTGLAAHAHGTDPDPARLAAEAATHGVAPVAAIRSLRW